jgi:hypothetical protein
MSPSPTGLPEAGLTLASLVDEFVEGWVRWREACDEVRSAYESWQQCKTGKRALLGAAVPILGLAVIVAFNVFYWLPIRVESPRPGPGS